MSVDIDVMLVRLVQLSRARGAATESADYMSAARFEAAADGMLCEVRELYAAQAARIAELGSRVEALEAALQGLLDRPSRDPADAIERDGWLFTPFQWAERAARRALTPGGEP